VEAGLVVGLSRLGSEDEDGGARCINTITEHRPQATRSKVTSKARRALERWPRVV